MCSAGFVLWSCLFTLLWFFTFTLLQVNKPLNYCTASSCIWVKCATFFRFIYFNIMLVLFISCVNNIIDIVWFFCYAILLSCISPLVLQFNQTGRGSVCSQAIMLVTDGATEMYDDVFEKYNWPERKVSLNRCLSLLLFVSITLSFLSNFKL